LPTYDEYPFSIQRADAWRYFVLHHIGGVYVDLDFECFRSVDSLFISGVVLSEKDGGAVTNAIMGSEAGHPFWERVWRQLERRKHWPVLQSTGPDMLTEAWRDWRDGGVSVLDRKYFWQATHGDSRNMRDVVFTSEAFGAHRYASSWHTGSRGWMRVKATVRFILATLTGSHRSYEAAAGVVRRFRRHNLPSN
jgi:mannosyltransferase OCH1-like enzyme